MSAIDVFVYGTLRRGGRYHDRFCRGLVRAEPARARGAIEWLPAGYPRLIAEPEDVLAIGSADLDVDAARFAVTRVPSARSRDEATVEGDLFTFDDAVSRLGALDRLEDFRPDGGGLYDRVILVVRAGERARPAWAYVAPLARSDLRRVR